MNEIISVIVPIYNVEQYLRKCIESIQNQTYKQLEIILVNDGSPDNCGSICDEYASKDSRIKVIHKRNGGLSDARNAGLDIMTGKYVAFVDSDDWIEPNMYEVLLKQMKKFSSQISIGGVVDDFVIDNKVIHGRLTRYGDIPFAHGKKEAIKRFFHNDWAAWDKLYYAKLFDNIRYPIGEINEDEAIAIKLIDKCNRVCYTSEVLYHYLQRNDNNSITSSSFTEKKLDWKKHCIENVAFVTKYYPDLIVDANLRYRSSLIWSINESALSNKNMDELAINLQKELRSHICDFQAIPCVNKIEKIKYEVLKYFPYAIYKKLILAYSKLRGRKI